MEPVSRNLLNGRATRDLVALFAVSAMWPDYPLPRLATSLADVLLNTLTLDFIAVRLRDQAPLLRIGSAHPPEAAEKIQQALEPLLQLPADNSVLSIPNPVASGNLRVLLLPIGIDGD